MIFGAPNSIDCRYHVFINTQVSADQQGRPYSVLLKHTQTHTNMLSVWWTVASSVTQQNTRTENPQWEGSSSRLLGCLSSTFWRCATVLRLTSFARLLRVMQFQDTLSISQECTSPALHRFLLTYGQVQMWIRKEQLTGANRSTSILTACFIQPTHRFLNSLTDCRKLCLRASSNCNPQQT